MAKVICETTDLTLYELLNPFIPSAFRPLFWTSYFSLTPLSGAAFNVVRLSGPLRDDGKPATILVAGRSAGFLSYLQKRFFASDPHMENLPPLRWWNLKRALTKAAATSDDLVFCEMGHFLAPRVFNRNFLFIPVWVGLKCEIPSDPAAFRQLLARVDGDLHLIRRNKLQSTMDSDLSDFEDFHQNYYRATALSRHGEQSVTLPPNLLLSGPEPRRLIWIHGPEGRIAGVLAKIEGTNLVMNAIGVRDANPAYLKQGALAACYYYSLLAAQDLGCTSLDFRGGRPSLTDGVFAYKRKWNTSVYQSLDIAYLDIAVHWSRPSPAVHHLFHKIAPIFFHNNQLVAASARSQRYPPGLRHVLELSADDLPADPADLIRRLP